MTTMIEIPHEKKIVIQGEAVEYIDGAKLFDALVTSEDVARMASVDAFISCKRKQVLYGGTFHKKI